MLVASENEENVSVTYSNLGSFSGTRAASPRFGNALCVTGSESAV